MVDGGRYDLSEFHTDRLLLRRWREDDSGPFAALNADPVAMEYFPAPLTPAESDALADRIESHFEDRGYGLWAVEIPGAAGFIGFVGLADVPADLPPAPGVEVGWRLAREHWGRGYATEAARAALHFAFGTLGLAEVVSFTAATNERSRRVMERLGMRHDPAGDFDHPRVAPGQPLRRHVLYRLSRDAPDQQVNGAAGCGAQSGITAMATSSTRASGSKRRVTPNRAIGG
jgi:ribosomal-protein-alanine N-acetyltransferase